jgi:hemolysin type calcium-binding protein
VTGIGAVALGCALLIVPAAAQAADYPVTNNNDAGSGSLRQAILDANATPGVPDTITISVPGPPNTVALASALPAISDDVTITGPGKTDFIVDGGFAFQPFRVNTGKTVSISDLTVTKGACFDGTCSNAGGAIYNQGNLTLDNVAVTSSITVTIGGAIFNSGTLTLNNSTVASNGVNNSGGVDPSYQGGGIYNTGTLNVVLSTISQNSVSASGYTHQGNAFGGGIFNADGATTTIDRSTVSGNSAGADGGQFTNAGGGGIFNRGFLHITRSTVSGNTAVGSHGSTSNNGVAGGIGNVAPANPADVTVTLDRTTLSDNSAIVNPTGTSQGGGMEANDGTYTITSSTIVRNQADSGANLVAFSNVHLKNTIVADRAGGAANCLSGLNNAPTSDGYNLSDDASCGFTSATDQENADPNLDLVAGLSDNGGPTKTYAILSPSPAIDQGKASAGETVDQRGMPRPSDFGDIPNASGGDGSDVGAFELQDTVPPDTFIDSGPANGSTTNDPTPTFTFHSSEAGSTFQCRVDLAPFGPCTSPRTIAHLADGLHTFDVRAKDAAANVDSSAASRSFTVKTAEVKRSGSKLVITAVAGAKDNIQITRPSASIIRITDLPGGAYSGSGIHTVSGSGCTRSDDYTANCNASGIAGVNVAAGGLTDKAVNSTNVTSSLNGGSANDLLIGGSKHDVITGAGGADTMKGMNGDDSLFARDLANDTLVNCDGGTTPGSADKADLDLLAKDPNSIVLGCETKTRH